ncbi:hypothetical protein A2U01_0108806, partial [Trifolium medium]|nr:hypothetical protein [Trifolium medium]
AGGCWWTEGGCGLECWQLGMGLREADSGMEVGGGLYGGGR